jgi:hypothetical protein
MMLDDFDQLVFARWILDCMLIYTGPSGSILESHIGVPRALAACRMDAFILSAWAT